MNTGSSKSELSSNNHNDYDVLRCVYPCIKTNLSTRLTETAQFNGSFLRNTQTIVFVVIDMMSAKLRLRPQTSAPDECGIEEPRVVVDREN